MTFGNIAVPAYRDRMMRRYALPADYFDPTTFPFLSLRERNHRLRQRELLFAPSEDYFDPKRWMSRYPARPVLNRDGTVFTWLNAEADVVERPHPTDAWIAPEMTGRRVSAQTMREQPWYEGPDPPLDWANFKGLVAANHPLTTEKLLDIIAVIKPDP